MTSSFEFDTINPSDQWQFDALHDFHSAPTPAARDSTLVQIAAAFAPHVRVIASSWWRRFGRIRGHDGLQDITSAGRQGLIIAAQRWRPDFEKPFMYFGGRWISESCRTEVARLQEGVVPVPLRVRLLCRDYRGLDPADGTRAEFLRRHRLRESTKRAVRFLAQSGPRPFVSLDAGETDDEPPFQLACEGRSVRAVAEASERLERIRLVLTTRCTPRQRLVLQCSFPELGLTPREIGEVRNTRGEALDLDCVCLRRGKTMAVIGSCLGITRERVRQIHNEAILKIRTALPGVEHAASSGRKRTTPNSCGHVPASCHSSATGGA